MGSPNGSNDTTHTPPPLSFYNTFNRKYKYLEVIPMYFLANSIYRDETIRL